MVVGEGLSIDQALACQQQLQDVSDTPGLDVALLLCSVLERPRSYLYTWPERRLNGDQQARFDALLARRLGGEPVAHLLGYREFWSLPLAVNAETLIPRPDSECLVEAALELFADGDAGRALDLGTGTGALALALASEWPQWRCWGVDKSPAAVALAERNRQALALQNVQLLVSDWFAALLPRRQFQLIVSNPPYIDAADPHLHQGDVRFEPLSALIASEQGLADLRHIVATAPQYLCTDGYLIVEHGFQQGAAVRDLLGAAGFVEVVSRRDYGGNERLSLGRLVA